MPGRKRIVIITFTIRGDKFADPYERNSFYRRLYGWKQVVRKGNSVYEYQKEGLLDTIPHVRIDQSLFAIADAHLREVESFFRRWKQKVMFNAFEMDRTDQVLNRALARKLSEMLLEE